MMRSAFNSVRPGSRPKYGKTDLIPEILVFFSWKKCGCGGTPTLLLRESEAKSTLYPMKGNVSHVLQ